MKRSIVILIIIGCLAVLGALFLKPAIIILTKNHLRGIFKQSQLSIGSCNIDFARQLSFSDLEIKKSGFYDIKIKEAVIRYNLLSILNPASRKLLLKTTKIYINSPKQAIADVFANLGLQPAKPGAPVLGAVGIEDLKLDLNTKDINTRVTLSCELDLIKQSPRSLDLEVSSFEMLGLKLEGGIARLSPQSKVGSFSIARLKYDKLSIANIKGALKIQNAAVILSEISARALNGNIEGDLSLRIEKDAQYVAHIKCLSLDIEKLVHDFEWQEKFEMSGKLSGEFRLVGKGAQFEFLDGNFLALSPGGKLTIKDAKFLDDMARNARLLKKPMDLIVESFKNYSYNTAIVNAGLEEGNIILGVELEGEAGKRNLEVILHDFKLGN